MLLVLLFFLTVLISFQDFFGKAITLLLGICVVILMLFVVYIMVSWITDTVRKGKLDEDKLSEKSLEQILSGETAKQRWAAQSATKQRDKKSKPPAAKKPDKKGAAAPLKAEAKKAENEAKTQDEAKASKAEEPAALTETLEIPLKAQPAAEAEAKDTAVPDAQEATLAVSAEAAEAATLVEEPEPQPPATDEPLQTEEDKKLQLEEEAAARKAQAIASARKQAEAIAAARRRAAQTAARTQAFAPMNTGNLPTFNTQIIEQLADLNAATPQPPVEPVATPEPPQSESIWEKMKVRQSAAPVLSSKDHIPTAEYTLTSFSVVTAGTKKEEPPVAKPQEPVSIVSSATAISEAERAERTSLINRVTASIPSGIAKPVSAPPPAPSKAPAPAEQDAPPASFTGSWSYTPAKLPDAWKTSDTSRKIPGDMSFISTQTLPALNPDGTPKQKKAETSATSPASEKPLANAMRQVAGTAPQEAPSAAGIPAAFAPVLLQPTPKQDEGEGKAPKEPTSASKETAAAKASPADTAPAASKTVSADRAPSTKAPAAAKTLPTPEDAPPKKPIATANSAAVAAATPEAVPPIKPSAIKKPLAAATQVAAAAPSTGTAKPPAPAGAPKPKAPATAPLKPLAAALAQAEKANAPAESKADTTKTGPFGVVPPIGDIPTVTLMPKVSSNRPLPQQAEIISADGESKAASGLKDRPSGSSEDTAGMASDATAAEAEAPKRPRGRPPKPKETEEDKPKRSRGRPPKDEATTAAPQKEDNVTEK